MSDLRKNRLAIIAAAFVSSIAFADVNMLQTYLDTAGAYIPNTMSISLYEEISYNDNIHNDVNGQKEGSALFKTGASATIMRTKGFATYGLTGDVSYDYYTKDSDDMSEYDWSLSPVLNISGQFGDKFLRGLTISITSNSVYEPYSKSDTRSVRHYENGIGLAYDYSRRERWGTVFTVQYMNYYYPQSSHDLDSSSYNEYEFGIAPYYEVTPKLKVGLHTTYTLTRYTDDKMYDDSDSVKINAFADYRFNMFFSVTGEVGMEKYMYDGESEGSNMDNDFEPDFSLTLRYVPTLSWVFAYMIQYQPEYGSERGRGGRMTLNNRLNATWQASRRISISNEIGYDYDNEKNCDDDTGEINYTFRVNYTMTDRISLYAAYSFNDVHFKYDGASDYHSNEYIIGLNWSLF